LVLICEKWMQFDFALWKIDAIWSFLLNFFRQITDFSSKLKFLIIMICFVCVIHIILVSNLMKKFLVNLKKSRLNYINFHKSSSNWDKKKQNDQLNIFIQNKWTKWVVKPFKYFYLFITSIVSFINFHNICNFFTLNGLGDFFQFIQLAHHISVGLVIYMIRIYIHT